MGIRITQKWLFIVLYKADVRFSTQARASAEIFPELAKSTFCLSCSGCWRYNADGRLHNVLPLLHHKKMTHVTVTIPKHALLWQQYFFLHRIKLRDLLLSAVIVSLHYLLQMFAFNSHMRQNTQTLLFIGNTFKTLKLSFKIQYIHILYIERI